MKLTEVKDKLKKQLKGHVVLTRVNENTGEKLVDEYNLVVDTAYTHLAHMLGGDFANRHVAAVRVGIGTVAPTENDTNITDLPSGQVELPTTSSYPTETSVKFHAEWTAADERTDNITEFGLFFDNNNLCSRVIFNFTRKIQGWIWRIDWTLYFPTEY